MTPSLLIGIVSHLATATFGRVDLLVIGNGNVPRRDRGRRCVRMTDTVEIVPMAVGTLRCDVMLLGPNAQRRDVDRAVRKLSAARFVVLVARDSSLATGFADELRRSGRTVELVELGTPCRVRREISRSGIVDPDALAAEEEDQLIPIPPIEPEPEPEPEPETPGLRTEPPIEPPIEPPAA